MTLALRVVDASRLRLRIFLGHALLDQLVTDCFVLLGHRFLSFYMLDADSFLKFHPPLLWYMLQENQLIYPKCRIQE